jgi:hypothetical protein
MRHCHIYIYINQCLLDVYYHICLTVLFMCLHTFICVYIHIYLSIYIYIYERGRERLGPRVGLASYMLRWPGCAAWGPAGLPGWLPKWWKTWKCDHKRVKLDSKTEHRRDALAASTYHKVYIFSYTAAGIWMNAFCLKSRCRFGRHFRFRFWVWFCC